MITTRKLSYDIKFTEEETKALNDTINLLVNLETEMTDNDCKTAVCTDGYDMITHSTTEILGCSTFLYDLLTLTSIEG